MRDKYQALIKVDEAILKKDSKTFTAVGWAKLALVLLLGFFIYLMFTREYPLPWVFMSAAAFIALVSFWIYHNKLEDSISYTKGQISICQRQIDRNTGQWAAFKDTGEEFVDPDHPYASDLDVVGRNSLFQMLNTTHTWHGRQAFAGDLLSSAYSPPELQTRQKAVAELSGNIEFSHRIQYFLSKIRPDPSLSDNLKQKTPFVKSKALQIFLTFAPVLTLAFNLAVVVFRLSSLYPVAAMIITLQMAAWIIGIRKTRKYLSGMSASLYKLGAYNDIIDTITGHEFACEKLRQIQGELRDAAQAVKKLTRIADWVSVRHNGLVYFLANVLLLWDYECALWFAEWKQKYAHQSEDWFTALGEFESLLSFSHLPNICGQTCLPEILEKENTLQATDMGHPL